MSAGLDTAALREVVGALSKLSGASDDSDRIDRIRLLEELKSAAAAAQALETAAFVASQRAEHVAAGVPARHVGRGASHQVGLAKRCSPFAATRYTGWATVLTGELPATFEALAAGQITEWRAMIVARETAWLSREHRARVDARLAPVLGELGDRRIEALAKKLAYQLDPEGSLGRTRGADSDRRVTLRPAPAVMARLGAFLPVAQGVAAYAALRRDADSLIASGEPRSRGQLMADLLVERLTGQRSATDVPVEITLVMTDRALLDPDTADTGAEAAGPERRAGASPQFVPWPAAGRDEPAELLGYGPVPAATARELIHSAGLATPMWLRRLYRHPRTGELAAMDTHRRAFTANQRLFLRLRDQDICRTPYCDAPIRHSDHVVPHGAGGPTSTDNGQGLCAACNHAKQVVGWHNTPTPSGHLLVVTATRHGYRHRPPEPPGSRARAPEKARSRVEARAARLLHAA